MKLTNHNDNNTYTIDTYVMRGTIEMTKQEFKEAKIFLLNQYNKAVLEVDTYTRDSLSNLVNTGKIHREQPEYSSWGVCATKLIAEKYSLKNYKSQNHGIKINDATPAIKHPCIYCEDNQPSEHFLCDMRGVGMCDDCYNADKEHDGHIHEPCQTADPKWAKAYIKVVGYEPAYLCDECINKIAKSSKL